MHSDVDSLRVADVAWPLHDVATEQSAVPDGAGLLGAVVNASIVVLVVVGGTCEDTKGTTTVVIAGEGVVSPAGVGTKGSLVVAVGTKVVELTVVEGSAVAVVGINVGTAVVTGFPVEGTSVVGSITTSWVHVRVCVGSGIVRVLVPCMSWCGIAVVSSWRVAEGDRLVLLRLRLGRVLDGIAVQLG